MSSSGSENPLYICSIIKDHTPIRKRKNISKSKETIKGYSTVQERAIQRARKIHQWRPPCRGPSPGAGPWPQTPPTYEESPSRWRAHSHILIPLHRLPSRRCSHRSWRRWQQGRPGWAGWGGEGNWAMGWPDKDRILGVRIQVLMGFLTIQAEIGRAYMIKKLGEGEGSGGVVRGGGVASGGSWGRPEEGVSIEEDDDETDVIWRFDRRKSRRKPIRDRKREAQRARERERQREMTEVELPE